jgi:hypothetical protein
MTCFDRATKLALAALACAGCSDTPEGTWVTKLADAWVGVKVEGEDAAAYVCGSGETLTTHTRWMHAAVDGDDVTFERDGWRLEVTVEVAAVKGELFAPDGAIHPVEAHLARDNQLEGLYTAIDAGCRAGLILVSSGDADTQGAWCDGFGHLAQVTPVMPVELTPNGIAVTADTSLGFRNFFVQPVVPAELAP